MTASRAVSTMPATKTPATIPTATTAATAAVIIASPTSMPINMSRDARPPDRGSASLCVLFVGMIISLFGAMAALVGSAMVARHQAGVAADLGALAGAARIVEGESAACGRAARFVGANGGSLAACAVDGVDLVVTARVAWRGRSATATARAGPVR